jgi:hypothetical protein
MVIKLHDEECKERFEVYERKTKDKSGVTNEMLTGARAEKKGYYHPEVNEYGTFEEKASKIPKGFKRATQKRRDRYVQDWACKKRKTKKERKKLSSKLKGALVWDKWYNASRKYWLTLKDFKDMKKGDKIVVLPLHQNALDGPQTYFKECIAFRPEQFFKSEKDTITYQGNMQVGSKHLNKPDNKSWGLDIEYAKNKWSTLFDGNLHMKNKLPKHWTKFNENTSVGYRGPMILWSDLKKLPKLYYS